MDKEIEAGFCFECQKIAWRGANFFLLIYFKVVARFPKQISFSIRFKQWLQTKKICPVASKLYLRSPRCGRATSPVLEQDRRSWILVLKHRNNLHYWLYVSFDFRTTWFSTNILETPQLKINLKYLDSTVMISVRLPQKGENVLHQKK